MQLQHAAEAYKAWLTKVKNLSEHTVRAYSSDIDLWLLYRRADTELRDLEADCLLAFVEDQRSRGLTERTVLRRVAALRGFLSWMVNNQLAQIDVRAIQSIRARRHRTLPKVAATRDLRRLYEHLRLDVQAGGTIRAGVVARPHSASTLLAVSLMLATGIRVGETVGILCSNIDLQGASIRVLGKGARDRTVYVPDTWLRELLASYLEVRKGLGISHGVLLFGQAGNPLTPASRANRATLDGGGGSTGRGARLG